MTFRCRIIVIFVTAMRLGIVWQPDHAAAAQAVPADVSLFRIFLEDGSTVVSYGEFARVGDEVVVAMPLGTDLGNPKLELVTLAAASVDWVRTDQYSHSVRYQQYAATRGEDDFAAMSVEVAGILNEIALTTEPQRALELADQARRMLAVWPAEHLGYRAADVRDIIGLIDDAASKIAGVSGSRGVQLSFVAMPFPVTIEPVLGQSTPRDQVRRLLSLAASNARSAERISLLRAALAVMDDPASGIGRAESMDLRRSIDTQIREEVAIDDSYRQMTVRLVGLAEKAAASARVAEVERVFDRVAEEDVRLGTRRPETIRALRAELDAQLAAARDLRLRRDQWITRRSVYRSYVESVSAPVAQLVKATAALEAIRQLAGPSPKRLSSLQRTLHGGVTRLHRIVPPDSLRATHEVLVAAWRFAESAAAMRQRAIVSGELPTAWQASSAAAGALLFLARAQREMRAALEAPTLK